MNELDFSSEGIKKIDAFFARYFKGELVSSKKDKDRFYAHVFLKAIQGETRYYELGSSENISGCPVTLGFKEEDFIYDKSK